MSYRVMGATSDQGAIAQLASQLPSIITKAAPALQLATDGIRDPFLPQLVCEVGRLSNMDVGKPPGPRCQPPTPAQIAKHRGVGLRHAVKVVQAYTFHRQHPWVAPLGLFAVLGGVYALGYAAGKRKR